MKFKQIAVAVGSEGDESLYALGQDGTLYTMAGRYIKPEREEGRIVKEGYFEKWWVIVDVPIGSPEVQL